ncbi:DNA polymerase III subunit delta' [Thalassotalea litorea]|uniref:DNA-directed DNA polymerase n=1 Tax=Thalassotalea litorea TaxID=2020715 RepID=A0A5R9IRC6_9GAMM|nr:DNA polymerase III subunit delta' [Thalassotalea litorea]TLU68080.1 DNA polymerase III subunit delta' [Thalassotalea litorea]
MGDNTLSQKNWLAPITEQLTQLLAQQKLPHGILFNGHPGSGTWDLGYWLARQLLCPENGLWGPACGHCKACTLILAGNHPDIVHIEAEKAHIGVESIRKANQFLVKKAQLGQSKVVIIQQAELMTEAAANALLKTLEEPTPFSFLLLTSYDSDRLLPTIQSRCTRFDIRPPVGSALKQSLGDSPLIDDYANMSHLTQLQDKEQGQLFTTFETVFNAWLMQPQQTEELVAFLTEHSFALGWLMQQFTAATRKAYQWQGIREHEGLAKLSQSRPDTLIQAITLITHASRQLKQLTQANKKFVIESLVIDLLKLISNNAEKRPR